MTITRQISHISFFALFIAIILCASPVTAMAGSHNSPDSDEELTPTYYKGIIPRTYYATKLFHDPSDPENIFYLRLTSYGEISGCFEITKSSSEKTQRGDSIKLKVTDQELFVKVLFNPRYSNYDCKKKDTSAYIDIKLDRDDMIKKGIKKIALKSEKYGDFTTADVNITKEKIELTAKETDPGFIDTLWFFPDNAIVLQAPKAKMGDKTVLDKIRKFGIDQGFKPMEDVLKGYTLPPDDYNYVVFTDPVGTLREQLKTTKDVLPVGHITATRTMHGPKGAYQDPYDLEVFASISGHALTDTSEETGP